MADQEENKKTIKDYKSDYEFFTGKASEISRNLAFAGIALIWIFHSSSSDGNIEIPNPLVKPLLGLGVTLTLDLFQYISGGLMWYVYYRIKEKQIAKKIIPADSDIKAPEILPLIIHFFYWSKLVSIVISYFFLLFYLYNNISSVTLK